jgi:drug/metabolite transporter (DMT)-like permease
VVVGLVVRSGCATGISPPVVHAPLDVSRIQGGSHRCGVLQGESTITGKAVMLASVSMAGAAAVGLSILTAFCYALSNVLELTEAEQVPDEYALKLSLLRRLVRRPRWLVGAACDVVGYVAQAAALALAAVVFVMPIIASGIIMALLIGARMMHRSVRPGDWLAAAVLSVGLAAFLYEVLPTGGDDLASARRWIVAGPSVVVGIGVCLICARGVQGPPRGALLGVAAGICFGVAAVLTKGLVHYLGDGVFAWVDHWEPYALAVASIGGLVIAQSALQTGALGAAVGASEAMIPITAAVLGIGLLNEQIDAQGVGWLVVASSGVAIVWGILRLASSEEYVLDPGGAPRLIVEPDS